VNPEIVKPAVRRRDGMRCTQCGMTNDQHMDKYGWSLEVHRLTPGSPYTVEGCVTLCRKCHGRIPKRPWRTATDVYGCGLRLPTATYRLLQQLAKMCHRPVTWELRRLVVEAAKKAGID
jgi:hypothetical protein